jgi:hypothetical protein
MSGLKFKVDFNEKTKVCKFCNLEDKVGFMMRGDKE